VPMRPTCATPARPIGTAPGAAHMTDNGARPTVKPGRGRCPEQGLWSASEGPQRPWRGTHLKEDDSGATPVASRPESGSAAWLQASAQQNLRGGGEEHGELWWPTRRDDNGLRGSSMTAERSTQQSGSRRRCGNGETRERTGSALASSNGRGATRDARWWLVAR
jgi:hypothetical protein